MTQQLLIHQAEIDSIEVTEDMVKIELDQRIQYFSAQVGGTEALEEFYGKSIEEIKEEFYEQIEDKMKAQKMQQEVQHKKELMELEFMMNMQLKNMEVEAQKGKEKEKEDRKDERTRIQATQQSELIDQRKSEKPPKNFESAGNDILGGGFDLGAFDPR